MADGVTERWDFWNGPDAVDRRITYAADFVPEYQTNGDETQRRIDALVAAYESETKITLPKGYASGWRAPAVNEVTKNAATASNHLLARAGDKRDTPDGELSWWVAINPDRLEEFDLFTEHPVATVVRSWVNAYKRQQQAKPDAPLIVPTPWCHLQIVPPKSKLRVYWPDTKAMPEWEAFRRAGGRAGMTYVEWAATVAPVMLAA